MSSYLNKTGSLAIEQQRLRQINSKVVYFYDDIPTNASETNGLYKKTVNNIAELYFNGNQLTEGGLASSFWKLESNILTPEALYDVNIQTANLIIANSNISVESNDLYFNDTKLNYWTDDSLDLSLINPLNLDLDDKQLKTGDINFKNKSVVITDKVLYNTNDILYYGNDKVLIWDEVNSDIKMNDAKNIDLQNKTMKNINTLAFNDRLTSTSGLYKQGGRLKFNSNTLQFKSENLWENNLAGTQTQMKTARDLDIQQAKIFNVNAQTFQGRTSIYQAPLTGVDFALQVIIPPANYDKGVLYLENKAVGGGGYNTSLNKFQYLYDIDANDKTISSLQEVASNLGNFNDIQSGDITATNNITCDTLNVNSGGTITVDSLTTNSSATFNGTFQGDVLGVESYVKNKSQDMLNELYFVRNVEERKNLITGVFGNYNVISPIIDPDGNLPYMDLNFLELDNYLFVNGKAYAKEFISLPANEGADEFFDFIGDTAGSLFKAGQGLISGGIKASTAIAIGTTGTAIGVVGGVLINNIGKIDDKDLDSDDLNHDLGRSDNNSNYMDSPNLFEDKDLFNSYGVNPRTSKISIGGVEMSEGEPNTGETIQNKQLCGGSSTDTLRLNFHEVALSSIHEKFKSIEFKGYDNFNTARRFDYEDADANGGDGLVVRNKTLCLYAERQNQVPGNPYKLNFNGDEYATLAEVNTRDADVLAEVNTRVSKSGDTMTGQLKIAINSTTPAFPYLLIEEPNQASETYFIQGKNTFYNQVLDIASSQLGYFFINSNGDPIRIQNLGNEVFTFEGSLVKCIQPFRVDDIINIHGNGLDFTNATTPSTTSNILYIDGSNRLSYNGEELLTTANIDEDKYFTLSGSTATSASVINDFVFDNIPISASKYEFNNTNIILTNSGIENDGTNTLYFNGNALAFSSSVDNDKYFSLAGSTATSDASINEYVFNANVDLQRITFNDSILNVGLEGDGADLYYQGNKLGLAGNIQNDKYFTLNGNVATTASGIDDYTFSNALLNFQNGINIQSEGVSLITANPLTGSPQALDMYLGGNIIKITNFNTVSYTFGSSTAIFDNFLFCDAGCQVAGEFSAGAFGNTDQLVFDPTQTGQSAKLIYQAKGANVSRFNIVEPNGTKTLSMGIQDSGNANEAFFAVTDNIKFLSTNGKSIFDHNVDMNRLSVDGQSGDAVTIDGFGFGAGFGILMNSNVGTGASGMVWITFRESSVEYGSISWNGSGTNYNTTSDYRLKYDIEDIPEQECVERMKKLRTRRYKWKNRADDQPYERGFIAHELEEDDFGRSVINKKDEVDEEGNPVYQGIDTKSMVADICCSVKYLIKQNDELRRNNDELVRSNDELRRSNENIRMYMAEITQENALLRRKIERIETLLLNNNIK